MAAAEHERSDAQRGSGNTLFCSTVLPYAVLQHVTMPIGCRGAPWRMCSQACARYARAHVHLGMGGKASVGSGGGDALVIDSVRPATYEYIEQQLLAERLRSE